MPVTSTPSSGFAGIPVWFFIAFFVVDTIIMMGVVFWALNKRNNNAPGSGFNGTGSSSFESPFTSNMNTSGGDSDVLNALRRGNKIEAIKLYRERTNCGLKEAKDAVEAMERQM